MEAIFISSIQHDFADVRAAARRAIDSLGMRPLMAETAGASSTSPQRALLDLVKEAEVFLLILGPHYSQPTEDEFNEAQRLSKEIIVLRQEGACDPDQAEFVERVSGGWSGGRLRGSFKDSTDVGFAVVQALTNRAAGARSRELVPRAQDLARELAEPSHIGGVSGTSVVRTVHVPLVDGVLLDALALETPGLGDRVAALSREHELVAQSRNRNEGLPRLHRHPTGGDVLASRSGRDSCEWRNRVHDGRGGRRSVRFHARRPDQA